MGKGVEETGAMWVPWYLLVTSLASSMWFRSGQVNFLPSQASDYPLEILLTATTAQGSFLCDLN